MSFLVKNNNDHRYSPGGLFILEDCLDETADLPRLESVLGFSARQLSEPQLLECVVYKTLTKIIKINFDVALKNFMNFMKFMTISGATFAKDLLKQTSVFIFIDKNFDNYKYMAAKKKWITYILGDRFVISHQHYKQPWYETVVNSKKFRKYIGSRYHPEIEYIASIPEYYKFIKSKVVNNNEVCQRIVCNMFNDRIIALACIPVIKLMTIYISSYELQTEIYEDIFDYNAKLNPKALWIISKIIRDGKDEHILKCFDKLSNKNKCHFILFLVHRRKINTQYGKTYDIFRNIYHLIVTTGLVFISKNLIRMSLYF